jgi:hypothetical protein
MLVYLIADTHITDRPTYDKYKRHAIPSVAVSRLGRCRKSRSAFGAARPDPGGGRGVKWSEGGRRARSRVG